MSAQVQMVARVYKQTLKSTSRFPDTPSHPLSQHSMKHLSLSAAYLEIIFKNRYNECIPGTSISILRGARAQDSSARALPVCHSGSSLKILIFDRRGSRESERDFSDKTWDQQRNIGFEWHHNSAWTRCFMGVSRMPAVMDSILNRNDGVCYRLRW